MKPALTVARVLAVVGLGLTVSACANVETVTRAAPYEHIPGAAIPVGYDFTAVEHPDAITVTAAAQETGLTDMPVTLHPGQSPVHVNTIAVHVPRSLEVSEANSYLPRADIVWRGDPIGDRYAQVQAIFQDALLKGVQDMNGPVAVNLEVEVTRFHALTEKARNMTGGVHNIDFNLAIVDAETGELVVPVREVKADLDAFGGRQAVLADARGDTQKVRISNHLAEVIRQELTNPEGYKNAQLGAIQLLNWAM